MWKCSLIGAALVATALAQNPPSQVDFANLREDVRGVTQRVGEMALRIEQLERENADLRQRSASLNQSYATVSQLDQAVAELNRTIKSAVATSKNETLQQVGAQMEKLGNATNAALESLAKAQATHPVTPASFADNYSKEGVSYTVQKGDNLALIAKKTGGRQQDIINANKLADPSRIVVGQSLFIPGGK